MVTKVLVVGVILLSLTLLVSGCASPTSPQVEEQEVQQRVGGQEGRIINPSLSCVGHCTGYVESGKEWCFCDAVCEQNQNCCSDFKEACPLPLSPGRGGPAPPAQPPDPTGLTREYPDFVKCSWVASPELPEVVQNLDELKQLGLNAVCIEQPIPQFSLRMSLEGWESMKLNTLSYIATVKRAGFPIVFLLNAGAGPEAEKEYTKLTKEQYLQVIEVEALEWAKLAEEYQVEYFAPSGELPSRLHNLFANYSEPERKQKKVEEANEWHTYMLPKLREVFKGKVMAALGDYTAGLNPQGYDVVAYSIGHNFITELEKFRQQKVKATYDISVRQAKENNAEWWVGGIYFAYEEDFNPDAPPQYRTMSSQLRELQDDYHRVVIEEIDALPPLQKPKGLTVGGYLPSSLPVTLTEESKEVIQEFLGR